MRSALPLRRPEAVQAASVVKRSAQQPEGAPSGREMVAAARSAAGRCSSEAQVPAAPVPPATPYQGKHQDKSKKYASSRPMLPCTQQVEAEEAGVRWRRR